MRVGSVQKDLENLELDEFYDGEKFGPLTWYEALDLKIRQYCIIPLKVFLGKLVGVFE